jgi:hypothetical protein
MANRGCSAAGPVIQDCFGRSSLALLLSSRVTSVAASQNWTFERDGQKGADYISQEMAFEAAILDASNKVQADNDVVRGPLGAGQTLRGVGRDL